MSSESPIVSYEENAGMNIRLLLRAVDSDVWEPAHMVGDGVLTIEIRDVNDAPQWKLDEDGMITRHVPENSKAGTFYVVVPSVSTLIIVS